MESLIFFPLKGAKRYRFVPFFFEPIKAQVLFYKNLTYVKSCYRFF
jgi:hypothetical protein